MAPTMNTEIDHVGAFLTTPLVQWLQLVLHRESLDIEDLVDGNVLSSIMIQIDPRPTSEKTHKNPKKDVNIRIQNLNAVLRHIKAYYEEIQQQVIVMSLPNILTVARDFNSQNGILEIQKLLLLILGCAVQCEQREVFIETMKQLTYEGMEIMMNHIKDMTENTDKILNMQWLEQEAEIPSDELDELTRSMSYHIRKLAQERDSYSMAITDLTQERDYLQSQNGSPSNALSRKESFVSPASKQHLMVEVSDLKAQLRKSKQTIDDHEGLLNDLRSELEEKDSQLKKLRQENLDLTNDARSARAYRDENDILKEKAGKALKLENEVERLNEKLKDVEFYKQRCEELREDNKVLHDSNKILEEQAEEMQLRLDDHVTAEKKIIELKQQLQEMSEERDHDRSQIQMLTEEKMGLEMDKKHSMNESGNLAYQLEQARTSGEGGRRSILAESEESSQTKILRLEKENRRLQSMLNSYKSSMTSSQISDAKMIELEKENKRLSNKVKQLQEKVQKEKQSILDVEQTTSELETQKAKLESTLDTIRSNHSRIEEELKMENEQLNKTVENLRNRAKINAQGRAKEVEKENKVLSETVKEITAKLQDAEFERKTLKKNLDQAKYNIERSETVQKENVKLEKDNISLQKKITQLKITCDQVDKLEQMNSDLDVENKQLQRQVDSLKLMTTQAQDVESEKANLEQENTRLKRQVESLRKSCAKLSEVEQAKLEAEKAVTRMQRTVANMQKSKKQSEKMEALQTELENELERVRNQLDVSTTSKDAEIVELEKENEELQNKLDKLVTAAKKLDKYESENKRLEQDNTQLMTYKKKNSKENERLKQSLESKSSKIDELNEELASLTRQNRALVQQNERNNDSSEKVRRLESDIRECKKQLSMDKKTMGTLREELVSEKLMIQQKQSELDKLANELESIGLNKQQLLKNANGDGDQSEIRFKALENRFESTFKKRIEAKEEKILSLESRLKESGNLNHKLREDIKNLKRDYEALAQRHQEEVDFSKSGRNAPSKNSATDELLKIKDHLISVERKNATMIAENSSLRSTTQDYKERLNALNTQLRNMQSQQGKLQENNNTLQTQCAKLQVENSLLQSQTASMVAQNANVTLQQNSLEGEKHDLARKLEEVKSEKQNLEKDHDDLMQLHENQTLEVENLMQDHQKLKTNHRQLRTDYKEMENKYNTLLKSRDEVEKLRKMLQSEHKRLEEGSENKDSNLDAIRETHEKLNKSYKKLSDDYEQLQNIHKTLKTNHNTLKLEHAKMEAESDDIKDRNHQLNLATVKLNNRCEVLMQLKENLEDENRHLLEQINRLMSQNEELLSQTLESKDQIHAEQKQYTERMQEIRRQKEKLEEKIMDLYRTPASPPKRNKGLGAAIKKTFGLGKSSENRRRRDGLPPSSSVKSKSSLLPNNETDFNDSYAAINHEQDNLSLGSHDSADRNRRGSVKDVVDSPKISTDSNKRRSRLGAGMAYSTNAINVLTIGTADDKGSDTNLKGRFQSSEDIPAVSNSQSSLDRDSTTSTGSAEVASQQIRATSLSHKSANDVSVNNVPSIKVQARTQSVSSEENQLTSSKPQMRKSQTTKEKISLQQFLDETRNSKSGSKDSQTDKNVPVKSPRSTKSPKTFAPLWNNFQLTATKEKSPGKSWPEGDLPVKEDKDSTKKVPPKLDLSFLQNPQPTTGRLGTPGYRASLRNTSPSKSTVALIKVDQNSENPISPKDKSDLKNGTMVYVVRSPNEEDRKEAPIVKHRSLRATISDLRCVTNKPALSRSPSPGSEVITLEQFLQENITSSESNQNSPKQVSSQAQVTMRPRPNGVHSRPTSMFEKPTGSVSPYSHLASSSMRMSERPVQSNISPSPRLTPSQSILSQNNRSGSAIERLDSLLGSNNDSGRSSVNTSMRNQTSTPTPVSRKQQFSTMSLPRPAQRTRATSQGNFSPHGLTSTPVATRQVDVAMVNPMKSPNTIHTPTRRDVPPESEPSPIRRDSGYRPRNENIEPQSNITSQRRPGTPTKPLETSTDSEKSTQWFEYGCV